MKTVLIVEDNLSYLRQLTESLSGFRDEFDFASAENGAEAINVLTDSSVDIVVTDLNMPIMDGFALLSHLRESLPHIPAVVLTGLTRPDVFERLKLYGDLKVLQKPVTPEVFVDTLRATLETSPSDSPKGLTLPELLQMLSAERRSCSLLVEADGRRGSLHFVSGELYDAYIFDEQLEGEQATAELLRWTDANIELTNVGDDEKPRGRFVKTPLDTLLAAAYPNLETSRLPQVQIVWQGKDAEAVLEQESLASAVAESLQEEIDSSDVQTEATIQLDEHTHSESQDVASTSQAVAFKTQTQLLAEEASVAELRQQLIGEAETLQETFERLQERAREADEALEAALSEFETFREQQRSYLAAEEAYQAKRKNLEQWREGAEDLAKKLLSAVQQVDEGEALAATADNEAEIAEDEKQLA